MKFEEILDRTRSRELSQGEAASVRGGPPSAAGRLYRAAAFIEFSRRIRGYVMLSSRKTIMIENGESVL